MKSRPKILLTGGYGYIGSHTYVELTRAGYDAIILDDLSNAKPSVGQRLEQITGKAPEFINASVTDLTALNNVFETHDFDAVIHFAGAKAVGESVENPLKYFNTNIGGLMNVLTAMQLNKVGSIVFSSSATVYGPNATLPFTEGEALGYSSPYAYTKMACEQILNQVCASNNQLNAGVLRYFNPVGADASGLIGEDPSDTPNNLMPYIASVASGERDQINVFGDDYDTPDGTGVRDYIHVSELAKGHVLSLQALLTQGVGHTVNLGTGQGYSVLEMITAYSKACGKELPFTIMPRRDGDIASMCASVTKAEQVLGFKTKLGLPEMCESSWNWINKGAKIS